MTEELTFRLHRDADIPGLARLWEVETDWGALSAETWREWFEQTPHGPCLVAVIVDGRGAVAGQMVFTPAQVALADREVKGLRISAPILRGDLRGITTRHLENVAYGLFATGAEAAARQGYGILYALPQAGWLSLLRRGERGGRTRFETAEYRCVSLPLATAGGLAAEGAGRFSATVTKSFGSEYRELWRAAKEALPMDCMVVRSPEWLRWRNGGNVVVEVRDAADHRLAGFASVNSSGLLFDILARTADGLRDVLAATISHLRSEFGDRAADDDKALKVMETPLLKPALAALGCGAVDYKFAFVCTTLGTDSADRVTVPDRWHIMPGD